MVVCVFYSERASPATRENDTIDAKAPTMLAITNRSVSSTSAAYTLKTATTSETPADEQTRESFVGDSPVTRFAAGATLLAAGATTIVLSTMAVRWLALKLAGLSVYDLVQCF